jgi:hypothetical protein
MRWLTTSNPQPKSLNKEPSLRTFELRQYTLRSKEALDIYMNQVYPRHLDSFTLFGIEAHGVWTVKDSVEPTAFVLVSYLEREDPGEVVRRYMGSSEFAEETKDWDRSNIVAVQSTILTPSASSPLK